MLRADRIRTIDRAWTILGPLLARLGMTTLAAAQARLQELERLDRLLGTIARSAPATLEITRATRALIDLWNHTARAECGGLTPVQLHRTRAARAALGVRDECALDACPERFIPPPSAPLAAFVCALRRRIGRICRSRAPTCRAERRRRARTERTRDSSRA